MLLAPVPFANANEVEVVLVLLPPFEHVHTSHSVVRVQRWRMYNGHRSIPHSLHVLPTAQMLLVPVIVIGLVIGY